MERVRTEHAIRKLCVLGIEFGSFHAEILKGFTSQENYLTGTYLLNGRVVFRLPVEKPAKSIFGRKTVHIRH